MTVMCQVLVVKNKSKVKMVTYRKEFGRGKQQCPFSQGFGLRTVELLHIFK